MAMKYQKGTVYPRGKKVKMWYGKYLIYGQDQDGKEVRKHRNVPLCPKAGTPKWKAEQMLRRDHSEGTRSARQNGHVHRQMTQ